ncbi:MAG: hypothetical protein CM1200mP4_2540 [Rhodospirillaceae bacterium]|nr:MAG: hypothetical protein CM1200mP4_2540 [Rhodospirillaceae bacterium]
MLVRTESESSSICAFHARCNARSAAVVSRPRFDLPKSGGCARCLEARLSLKPGRRVSPATIGIAIIIVAAAAKAQAAIGPGGWKAG